MLRGLVRFSSSTGNRIGKASAGIGMRQGGGRKKRSSRGDSALDAAAAANSDDMTSYLELAGANRGKSARELRVEDEARQAVSGREYSDLEVTMRRAELREQSRARFAAVSSAPSTEEEEEESVDEAPSADDAASETAELSTEERELVQYILQREGAQSAWTAPDENYYTLVKSVMVEARGDRNPWVRLRKAYELERKRHRNDHLHSRNVPGSGQAVTGDSSSNSGATSRVYETQALIRMAMERFWQHGDGRSFLANDLVADALHESSLPASAQRVTVPIGPPAGPEVPVEHRFRRSPGVCSFCQSEHRRPLLDPMNWGLLRQYMTSGGNILPRRLSGNCAKHQRRLARTIRRAKHLGIVSYKKGGFRILNPFQPILPAEQHAERTALAADLAASPLAAADGYLRFRGLLIDEIRRKRADLLDDAIGDIHEALHPST